MYLHNLVLELGQEEVHNLVLLDGQAVKVDLLDAGDLAGLDETAELGHGLPFLLLALGAATTTASTSTAAVTARAESTTSTSTGSVSHLGIEGLGRMGGRRRERALVERRGTSFNRRRRRPSRSKFPLWLFGEGAPGRCGTG